METQYFKFYSSALGKDINVWVDYWGTDCAHDWDWWYKQVNYFVPWLLEQR